MKHLGSWQWQAVQVFLVAVFWACSGCRTGHPKEDFVALMKKGKTKSAQIRLKEDPTLACRYYNLSLPTGSNGRTQKHWPALFIASWYGQAEIVSQLLDIQDVETGEFDDGYGSPLFWEISQNHTQNAIRMIRRGLYVKNWGPVRFCQDIDDVRTQSFWGSVLHAAVTFDDTTVAKQLLKQNINIDKHDKNAGWPGLLPPLQLACEYQRYDMVSLLLDHGADVTLRSPVDTTALHFAARKEGTLLIRVLLQAGASPENSPGAIYSAASSGNLRGVKFLADHGFDVNQRRNGWSPALRAIHDGNIPMLDLLFSLGANVDGRYGRYLGWFALALRGNKKTDRDLVSYIIDHRLQKKPEKYFQDDLAMWVFIRTGKRKYVEFLLNAGVDPNGGRHGTPYLVRAIKRERFEIAELLLKKGASIDVEMKDGTKLIDWVENQSNERMLKLLKAAANPE